MPQILLYLACPIHTKREYGKIEAHIMVMESLWEDPYTGGLMLLLLLTHTFSVLFLELKKLQITMAQQVSHGPIKCQSRSWSQRGTEVNGSHHGDNPEKNQRGSKSRQNPCQVHPTENIGNLPASRRCLWVRTTVSTVSSPASTSESEFQATEKTV